MPNTKSAIRRVRRVKKQTLVNRIRKSKYKTAVKQMENYLKAKEKEKAKKYFSKFQKESHLNNQFQVDWLKNKNQYLESNNKILKLLSSSCNFFFHSICTIVIQPKANYFLILKENCCKIF